MTERRPRSHRPRPAPPTQELAPNGAVSLRLAGRDGRGRFARGNTDSTTHGATSERTREELAPVRREMRVAVLTDRGHTDEDVPRVLSVLIDQFCEARMIAATYFAFLVESGGPISTRGRQRRAVDGYLRAAERVQRLAQVIGVERKQKATDVRDWFTSDDGEDEHEREPERDEHEDSTGGGEQGPTT